MSLGLPTVRSIPVRFTVLPVRLIITTLEGNYTLKLVAASNKPVTWIRSMEGCRQPQVSTMDPLITMSLGVLYEIRPN